MIYFLHGDTAPLQIKYGEIIDKIKSNNPSIPEKIFDASLDEVTLFFDSISTNSIFSPKELIILKRAEDFKNLDGIAKSLKMYNLAQKEIVIVYEEFLNDYGKIKNPIPKKTLDNFQEIAEIICFRKENEKKAIIFYIQHELNISEYEAEKFVELVGDDFFKVKNEVEKVKSFLDGDSFNLEKVKPLLSINEEYNLKNLIDDAEYTRNYFQKAKRLGMGMNKIIYHLKKEGVSPFIIDEYLEEYSQDLEYDKAVELVQKLYNENTTRPQYALIQNIRNKLFNKGFSQDVVERAIENFDFSIPKEHTMNLLTKEYYRVYNRYKNRYQSHILKSKIITFLVQKGYEYDDVMEIIQQLWEDTND